MPEKFRIDKRKAHLSTLISSGQISREEALKQLEQSLYPEDQLKVDMEYVLKKFGLTHQEFDAIMKLPPRSHEEFKTDRHLKESYMNLLRKTEPIRKVVKRTILR